MVGLPTAELVDVSADDEQAWVSYDRQEGQRKGFCHSCGGIVPDDGIATIRAGKKVAYFCKGFDFHFLENEWTTMQFTALPTKKGRCQSLDWGF